MTPNKRDLKAYVRFDGMGRIVAGSLILAQTVPKNGKWKEIDAYECCNPIPTPPTQIYALTLLFDNISNADTLVGDASNVDDWNIFFDLIPYGGNGNAFTSVSVQGNTVVLTGGSNIHVKQGLFQNYTSLIEIRDTGAIEIVGYDSFVDCDSLVYVELQNCKSILWDLNTYYGAFSGCDSLQTVILSNIETIEDGAFYDCPVLTTVTAPKLRVLGLFELYGVFYNCQALTSVNFPLLEIIGYEAFYGTNLTLATDAIFPSVTYVGDYAFSNSSITQISFANLTGLYGGSTFSYCSNLTSVNLPSLTQIVGSATFNNCTSLTTVTLPSLTLLNSPNCFASSSLNNFSAPLLATIGNDTFIGPFPLQSISIPSCTNLGSTVGNNNVFFAVTGNTITLTVPTALMTCNAGNPDGDIQYLQANNTVTVITV